MHGNDYFSRQHIEMKLFIYGMLLSGNKRLVKIDNLMNNYDWDGVMMFELKECSKTGEMFDFVTHVHVKCSTIVILISIA